MTAGPAASRRVGINGRTSPPPDSSLPEVCSFQLPKVCSFRLPLTDPDIRQEIARLKEATSGGNRSLLGGWGGYKKAVERLMELRQLPEGTPTKTKARGAIDRFQIWSTVRLTGPEVAI